MTLNDLERPKRTFAEKIVYGAHQKNLNKDSPKLSEAQLVSRNIKYSVCADIREGSWGMVVKRQWGCRSA